MIDQNLDENCNVPIAGSVASEQHLHGDPAIKVSSGQENLLKQNTLANQNRPKTQGVTNSGLGMIQQQFSTIQQSEFDNFGEIAATPMFSH